MKANPLMRVLSAMLLVICLAGALTMSVCSSGGSAAQEESVPEEPKYTVQLFVECEQNLFFSKYDVDVEVDGEGVGNVDHGSEATFEVSLTKGQHEIVFEKEGASEPDGKTSFVVEGDGDKFSYRISCTRNQIEIESIEEDAEAPADADETDVQVVSYDGASIEVPSTWKLADTPNGKYVYPDYGGMDYLYASDMAQVYSSADEAYSKYMEGFLENEACTASDEVEKTKVGEALAFRTEGTLRQDDVDYAGEMELVLTKGKVYDVVFAIPESVYDQHSGDVDTVLGSVKLENSSAPVFEDGAEEEHPKEDDSVPEPEPEPEPEPSKYEYACVRRMSSYDLYYLIDFDEMTVTYFSTDDSPMVLPCTGDLSSGLTVDYVNDGFHETLKYKTPDKDSVVVLVDANGFDWEYRKVDVVEAEAALVKVS